MRTVIAAFCILPMVLATRKSYGNEMITHTDLNKKLCYNSKSCNPSEVCERICFWQEYTEQLVGCKVACVSKYPEVLPSNGEKILPFEPQDLSLYPPAPAPQPQGYGPAPAPQQNSGYSGQGSQVNGGAHFVGNNHGQNGHQQQQQVPQNTGYGQNNGHQQQPAVSTGYQAPALHPNNGGGGYQPQPAQVPPPSHGYQQNGPTSQHKTVCSSAEDCGHGQHCGYDKLCTCNAGYEPDPSFPERCVNLAPTYGNGNGHPPVQQQSQPSYQAQPANAQPARHCYSKDDCHYGEKCCNWRKCNQYGNCVVQQMCAKSC